MNNAKIGTPQTPKLAKRLNFLSCISHVDFMLAGGSCFDAVKELFGNYKYGNNDYDLFFENENNYQLAIKLLEEYEAPIFESEPDEESAESEWAKTLYINNEKIQLIKIFKPFSQQIEEFDINNSKFWSFYPFDKVQTNQTFTDLIYLNVNNSINQPINMMTIKRIFKYHQHKYLDISEMYPVIFDIFVNPEKQNYTGALYHKHKVESKSAKETFLGDLLVSYLNLLDFAEYAKQKEQEQLLPYNTISNSGIHRVSNVNLPTLKVEIIKRGFSAKYTKEEEKILRKYYPEVLL